MCKVIESGYCPFADYEEKIICDDCPYKESDDKEKEFIEKWG